MPPCCRISRLSMGASSGATHLCARRRTGAAGRAVRTLIEVAFVLICTNTGRGQQTARGCQRDKEETNMADMDEMSKPKRPPPMTAMAVMK